MKSTHHESVSVTPHDGRLVRIRHVRQEDGVDMGGELWLGLDAVPWLVGALNECIENLTSSETEIGPDSLRVREKGHELDPKVGIGNRRIGSVQHAGRYFPGDAGGHSAGPGPATAGLERRAAYRRISMIQVPE